MLEAELQRHVVDVPGSLLRLEVDGSPQLGQRRTPLRPPAHDLETTSRTRHGQVVADQPESEIVRDEIRSREKHQQTRENESHGINAQPEAVPVSIPRKLRAKPDGRAYFGHVIGEEQASLGLPAQVPEQPLLADALRNPPHHARLRAGDPAAIDSGPVRGLPVPPLTFGLRQHVRESTPKPLQHPFWRLCFRRCFRLVRHLAVQLVPVLTDRKQIHIHVRVYDSIRPLVRSCSAKMPPMRGGVLLALALVAGDGARTASVTLELRVFNGLEDVTRQTRVAVHRAGDHTSPFVQLSAGPSTLSTDVPAGIYDVQAIRERDGHVLNIRWAQRLVVMHYPDEAGRHLEVINFQNGFGALQVRGRAGPPAEAGMYRAGEHTSPVVEPMTGPGYLLFVAPAGAYDLQTRAEAGPTWHIGLEVPLDRTRLWIAP